MKSRRIITKPEQQSLDFAPQHQYSVRRSKRAKYLRINAHPRRGIEVVVPGRMSLRHVEPFVRQHKDWINQQVIQLKLDQPVELPKTIYLRMIDETWHIKYTPGNSKQYRLSEKGGYLTITGPASDPDMYRNKLNQWLRKQAKLHLPSRLTALSNQCGLKYQRVSIRTQQTRWGSCSSKGNINLNDRLIMLPPELADYVMLHELCHTQHMNHSARFWELVKSHMPDYRSQQKQLRQSKQYLSGWL